MYDDERTLDIIKLKTQGAIKYKRQAVPSTKEFPSLPSSGIEAQFKF
jgi:hypothetical protein